MKKISVRLAFIGPDGTENQLIACHHIEDCYEKATEVCTTVNLLVKSGK